MYEPDVTIIIPTYNIVEEGYADDFTLMLRLLDKQTYPNVEHLVMDNASTDETPILLKDYKNKGYINFLSAPDNGKYDAINNALYKARGKYVGILSCDDFFHDITAIADIVNLMETENADFCCYPTYYIQEDFSVFQYVPSLLNVFQVNPCPHQGVFYRKETLMNLGNFDAKFKILADYDMMIRMIMNKCSAVYYDNTCVTCHEPLSIKRTVQLEAEARHIYYKNYKSLYNMTDEVLDRLVKLSEIPKPLLDRFATYFPEDNELFYQRYQEMYDMRAEGMRLQRQEDRMNRWQR